LTVSAEIDQGLRMRRVGVAFVAGHLDRRLDGEPAKGSALADILPIQTIGPDSHGLIEGGPSDRRRFLDWGVFHVEPTYLETWQRYRRVLGQRNTALKNGAPPGAGELRVWTKALIEAGTAIDHLRAAHVAALETHARDHARALLDDDLSLEYRRGWPPGTSFEDALADSEARDRLSGHTDVGPHRADVAVCLDGRKVENVASRGQQKLIAAALILGQQSVVAAGSRGGSLLLVDDPAAELDRDALRRLLDRLPSVGSQLVLTGIEPIELAFESSCARFHVERGRVTAL